MKQGNQTLLQLGIEVNQQVAAAQDIELGERRIGNDILLGKDDHVADLFPDQVIALVLHEKPFQSLGRYVAADRWRKTALARAVDGVGRQVGGKNLQAVFRRRVAAGHHFMEHHGQRIGFLSRGTGRYPGLEGAPLRVGRQHLRQDHHLQVLPHFRVAEKIRHADQQFLEQQVDLRRIVAQIGNVLFHRRHLVQAHAALDAAQHRIDLVVREAVARMFGQQGDNFLQGIASARLLARQRQEAAAKQVTDDLFRHLVGKIDEVHRVGGNRALRHHVELGRIGMLGQGQATGLLDGLHAARTVAAHAGQNHAHGQFAQLGRQAFEESIDGQAVSAQLQRLAEHKVSLRQAQVRIGRNHIDMVRLQFGALRDFRDGNAGGALQQFRQHGFLRGIEVLDHHIGDAALRRYIRQESDNRVETTGRRADGHHGKIDGGHLRRWSFAVFAACHRRQECSRGTCARLADG